IRNCKMSPDAIYNLEDVFVTDGVPGHTFVAPPNYGDIYVDVRKPGKPVIIEGQSGTGKTTTIKSILSALRTAQDIRYLTARVPENIEEIEEIALNRTPGFYVID